MGNQPSKEESQLRPRPLTRRGFRRWLYAQPADRAFQMNHGLYCPLAQYSRSPVGCAWYYPWGYGYGKVPLPRWAKKFVEKFDVSRGTLRSAKAILRKLR